MFRVPEDLGILILPPKYIDELKSQPQSVLSSTHAVADVTTNIPTSWEALLIPVPVFPWKIYDSGHYIVWSYSLGCFKKTSWRTSRSLGRATCGRMFFRTRSGTK